MNQNQIFKFNGNEIRIVMKEGNPWWVAKDVCSVLELGDISKAVSRLDEDEKGTNSILTPGGKQVLIVVNEPGLYSLILGSRKPEAKQFKRWVTHDVLPMIRKHGAYMTDQTLERALTNPDFLIQLASKLKEEQQARLAAETKIEAQKPLVTFAEICLQSDQSIKVRELAHSLSSHGIKIGSKRLFEKLREWKYIEKVGTEPTQRATEQGLFEVVTGVKQKPSGEPFTWRTPYVTVKGQIHIADRLKKGS